MVILHCKCGIFTIESTLKDTLLMLVLGPNTGECLARKGSVLAVVD